MMKLKIIADNKIPFLRGRLEDVAEMVYADPSEISPAMVAGADALIVRTRTKCDSALLAGSDVKLVATATIGMDHIDTQWCETHGIHVRNAAGCNAPGVAQYVWSALLREGFDPSRHKLGVVGYGHIGSIVTDWGRKMGAEILVCDPPRKDMGLTDEHYRPLSELLKECDALSLHTPMTKTGNHPTYHLIGLPEFSLMKEDAILVNAARGSVVDNAAWAAWLAREGRKAVVDVWEGEPAINESLLALSRVATPHIAGYSCEGKQRATRMAINAVEEVFGINADTSGLEGGYITPSHVDASTILASYDPYADTARLKGSPEAFEQLRSDYDYRHEPVFH